MINVQKLIGRNLLIVAYVLCRKNAEPMCYISLLTLCSDGITWMSSDHKLHENMFKILLVNVMNDLDSYLFLDTL